MANKINVSFRKCDQAVGSIEQFVSNFEKSDKITWNIPDLYALVSSSIEKKIVSKSFTVHVDDGITHQTWFLALVLVGSYQNGVAGYCLFPCFIPNNDCEEALVKIELAFLDEENKKVWARRFDEICRFNTKDRTGSISLYIHGKISSRVTAYCKIIQPDLHEFSLSSDLGNIFKNQNLTDVKLVSNDGTVFEAHKMMLAARSLVFAAMLTHQMKEHRQNQIDIADMTGEVVEDMLRYIYTDKPEKLRFLAKDLFVAADKYDLRGLKTMSEEALIKNLSISNAVEILHFSEFHNVTRLKTEVVKFITTKKNAGVFETEAWESLEQTNLLKEICKAFANR